MRTSNVGSGCPVGTRRTLAARPDNVDEVRIGLDRAGKTGLQELREPPVLPDERPASDVGPIQAEPAPDVTALFASDHGWTGGDAAYSVPLSEHKNPSKSQDESLWFFGDSFIGDVVDGQRTSLDLVRNADAVQRGNGPLQFGWRPPLGAEFDPPGGEGGYYWPGYGIAAHDEVYLFAKHVENVQGPPGFNFQWMSSDLVTIDNPHEASARWHYSVTPVPGTPDQGLFGTAGVRQGNWLYVYGITDGQVQVARTAAAHLPTMSLTYWDGHQWASQPGQAAPLFGSAATEMSVCQVPGRSGFYAVYTQGGLGADIVMRHAEHPWGPWSAPRTAYHCPETGVYIYAAKAHPELSEEDGTLVVTYCCNPKDFQQNVTDPTAYRPRGVRLKLGPIGQGGPSVEASTP